MTALVSAAAAFVLTSPAFGSGAALPARYTCDGPDVSPPLRWTAPPAGTRSLALHLVDRDTPRVVRHWAVTGLPASLRRLAEGSEVGRAHRNDFGRTGYTGPCPRPGQRHHYLFQLVALGARGRVLARAPIFTTYRRGG